jgi:thiamine-monophosphate kinase
MKKKSNDVTGTGEFDLIDRLKFILPEIKNKDVLVGIGDDTAVIKINTKEAWLVTCDIQIENRHFRLKHTSLYDLGKRAVSVNLSDIAAMGGDPAFALVSLGLPPNLTVADYDALFKGMRDQMKVFDAHIIGGNLSGSQKHLIIDITVIGKARIDHIVQRKGAAVGDGIYVTGTLGASGAGLAILEKYGRNYPEQFQPQVDVHLSPQPRVAIGKALAREKIASAMIDLSDGVAGDLYHICQMNDVGALVYLDALPFTEEVREAAKLCKLDMDQLLLHSGEDYELLFTAPDSINSDRIQEIGKGFGIPIHRIGEIVLRSFGYKIKEQTGEISPLKPQGWDHFKTV